MKPCMLYPVNSILGGHHGCAAKGQQKKGRFLSDKAKSTGTVGKAMLVLDQVASYPKPIRFSAILAESEFPKPTLYRILQNLVAERLVAYDKDSQTYSLGARLVRLAHFAWANSTMAPLARPFLADLGEKTGETLHLAQLDGPHVLYLDKRAASQPLNMFSEAGKVGPAYCTGVGKAMLAFLPEKELEDVLSQQSFRRYTPTTAGSTEELSEELADIRQRGYALDDECHEVGIICVAMPIISGQGRMLGALSVTSNTARTSLAHLETFVPDLEAAAKNIAAAVEHWRFPDNAHT